MSRRRSTFQKQFAKIKNLPRNERMLFQRLGELVDAGVNNRGPANPTIDTESRIRVSKKLPPVARVNVRESVRTAILEWDAIDSPILQHYKVVIQNLQDGTKTEATTFTNNHKFKGRDGGSYRATVQSVGRNGTASRMTGVTFTMPDNVMLLEGNKNGVTTSAIFVNEPILTPKNHFVFIWGSFVMDGFSTPGLATRPQITLKRGLDLDTADIIESFELFGKSETVSSFNDSDFSPPISRPAGLGVRPGTLETTHSVMFTPFQVEDQWADVENTFWLEVDETDFEGDIVSLSIVIWITAGGRGDQLPTVEPAGHKKAILLDSSPTDSDTNKMVFRNQLWSAARAGMGGFITHPGCIPNISGEIANWSIGFWIKPGQAMALDQGGVLFSLRSQVAYNDPLPAPAADQYSLQRQGCLRIGIGPVSAISIPSPAHLHSRAITEGLFVETYTSNTNARFDETTTPPIGPTMEMWAFSPLNSSGNIDYNQIWHKGLNEWYFFVFTWDGLPVASKNFGLRLKVYRDGVRLPYTTYQIAYLNFSQNTANNSATTAKQTRTNLCFPGEAGHASNDGSGNFDQFTPTSQANHYPMSWHSVGIWDNFLAPFEVKTLFNSGKGFVVDWRENQGSYVSARKMLYYWRLGDTTFSSAISATKVVSIDRSEFTYDYSRTCTDASDPTQTKNVCDLVPANATAAGDIDPTDVVDDFPDT